MDNEGDTAEYSLSGDRIYHYGESAKPFTPARGSSNSKEIEAHIEQHLGRPEIVMHELASHLVHIDVHIVSPSQKAPFYTLVSSGMSNQPMRVPQGYPEYEHAELLIHLPPTWSAPESGQTNQDIPESTYWPIQTLKYLARFPHEHDTWLGLNHTIPNGDPPVPFGDSTNLSGMMLILPIMLSDAFTQLKLPGKMINFYLLFPLYPEEMEFKLKNGADALMGRLNKAGTSPIVDVGRKNVCRKRFGLL